MKGPLKNARQFDEKEAYNTNLTDSARLHYLENERHDAPGKMMGKSPTKMKYESASQERSNLLSMNPLSKHMSTPLNMYKNSPAQMANSAIKMSDKSAMKMSDKSAMKMSDKSAMKMNEKSPLEANPNPSGKNESRQTYSAKLTTKPKPKVKAKKEKTNSGPTQQKQIMNSMRDAALSGLDKKAASGKTLDRPSRVTRDQIEKMTKLQDIKAAAKKYGASSNVRDYIK
jgi:hypothetical protein